jgi:hypothetical protein
MVMSVMLVVEATYNCAVSVGVKLLGWKPERRFKWEPLAGDDGDEEKGMMLLLLTPWSWFRYPCTMSSR